MNGMTARRCARCGGTLARDRHPEDQVCAACNGRGSDGLPPMPHEFWRHEVMRQAFASRNFGQVIRAYRIHPLRGRPLPQPVVAEALGISQPQLSRIENHGQIQSLDTLVFYARTLHIPGECLWFDYPDDPAYTQLAATHERDVAGALSGPLFEVSSRRTRLVTDAVGQQGEHTLVYTPPRSAFPRLDDFIASPARVCVVEGPPGAGKSELTYEIARRFGSRLTVQLHSVDTWPERRADLAQEILRYASVTAQVDPMLQLERELEQPEGDCLVIVDGLKAHSDVLHVGQQVDQLLRQIPQRALRFLLVIRTPPRPDLTSFPVLTALSYRPDHRGDNLQSIGVTEWSLGEARQVWNTSRAAGEPSFTDLPLRVQQLARLPLYMKLLKSAGQDVASGGLDSYWLVDACVRALARAAGADEDLTVDALAEHALTQLRDVVPLPLREPHPQSDTARSGPPLPAVSPLIDRAGTPVFGHDIIREYAAATAIATIVTERGRTTETVAGINQLAADGRSSATARGLLAFIVSALDGTAPEALRSLALAPALSVSDALPLMLAAAGAGSTILTPAVLRRCAARCQETDKALGLAHALLTLPELVPALGAGYGAWAVGTLDRFGPDVWADLAQGLEHHADAATVRDFVAHLDLNQPQHAVFVARYAHLFLPLDDEPDRAALAALIGHPDWRVRAALATGLAADGNGLESDLSPAVDQLVRDEDYKVRAAVAAIVTRLALDDTAKAVQLLLSDANWHVRACTLNAILDDGVGRAAALRAHVIEALVDPAWQRCPPYLDRVRHRFLLLHDPRTPESSSGRDHALFGMLREANTGWLSLPDVQLSALREQARSSRWWLLQRERGLALDRAPLQAPSARQAFRQLRDGSSVQIALDLRDLELAVHVAQAAVDAGAHLIEVGDPLIKEYGLKALAEVKRRVPAGIVVAEMMSADWGRDQVVLAAEAGADAVLLIGPATASSVSAAVTAGSRLGVPILLDAAASQLSETWIREMERLGIDGFTVTTNIDLGVRGRHPLDTARAIRSWSRLPVAVSGGFSSTDHDIVASPDWDILIIGRSVAEAVDPAEAARQLIDLVRRRQSGRRHAHRRDE
ncbi:orotidine 5'-phosphate decarboxylase / HUMPS family protein [Actinoplanes sp. NPDC026623]|uniref:orotidine 5'-phosphate decarboxylase / HUMPS family protein n=1 Tax=Actinoplanes sp. NPDC026623 TaxID=3155610 RepID=UPI00340C1131